MPITRSIQKKARFSLADLQYCQPIDVARRIVRKKQFWFHGNPAVFLIGLTGTFGILKFDFTDETLTFEIYIKDRTKIINAAETAIQNFSSLIKEFQNV